MGNTAVVVDGLRFVRGGRTAVDGVSFRAPIGEVTGLLGPSGCGKSSLMRSVVGVQVVAGGTVTVLGSPAGSPGLRHRVGYVTQAPSVYDDLTVEENVRYFGRVLGAPPTDADRVIGVVDLGGHREGRVGRLSRGQRLQGSPAVARFGPPGGPPPGG